MRRLKRPILNPDLVRELRAKHKAGVRICDLVSEYGVSRNAINAAVNYRTWKRIQ